MLIASPQALKKPTVLTSTSYALDMTKYVYVQLRPQAGAAAEKPLRIKGDTVEKSEAVYVVKQGDYQVAKLSAPSVDRWWLQDED